MYWRLLVTSPFESELIKVKSSATMLSRAAGSASCHARAHSFSIFTSSCSTSGLGNCWVCLMARPSPSGPPMPLGYRGRDSAVNHMLVPCDTPLPFSTPRHGKVTGRLGGVSGARRAMAPRLPDESPGWDEERLREARGLLPPR